jgi:hypothetical protein
MLEACIGQGNLVADFHSILVRWGNLSSHLLNVHGVKDVTQTEIHTAELLVPEPNAFEVEMVTEKLKSQKSPGTDQIPAELRQGVEQLALRSMNSLFLFGIRRNC